MTYDRWKTTDPRDREPAREEKRESVSDALDHVLDVLDIVAAMALKPETYDEVAAEELALGQVISRAQLILSFIDTHRPHKVRVVQ